MRPAEHLRTAAFEESKVDESVKCVFPGLPLVVNVAYKLI